MSILLKGANMKEERTNQIPELTFDAFRKNLNDLIVSHGMMRKDFAEMVGISPISVTRYFTEQREPDIRSVYKSAQAFGVSMDWLLGVSVNRGSGFADDATEFANLYSIATEDDRKVIQAVLSKYRGKA